MNDKQVSIHCPYCSRFTAITPAPLKPGSAGSRVVETYFEGNVTRAGWWMGKCHSCQKPVLVFGNGELILPSPQPAPVSDAIPEPMQSDLREAKQGKKLGQQIVWLEENRKITPPQFDWANAARWVGNHGAHDTEPDVSSGNPVITNVAQEDALATIELVEHLFESIYVAGKLAQKQLDKRGKL